jgi:hypothetical protein
MNVKIGADTQPLEQGLSKSKSLLMGFAGGVGIAIAGVVGRAISSIGNFIREGVNAAADSLSGEQRLLTALKGRVDTQQMLIKQAKELSNLTLFEDDETVKAQAMLAAYVKNGDQIKQLIPLVQDLATAKGMDLASAADLVGRAVGTEQKSIRGLGVELKGAAGSAEKTESAIRALTDAFGGQAEAAALVGQGPMKQFKVLLGEIGESIGGTILPFLNALLIRFNHFLRLIGGTEEETQSVSRGMAAATEALIKWDKAVQSGAASKKDYINKVQERITQVDKNIVAYAAKLRTAKLSEMQSIQESITYWQEYKSTLTGALESTTPKLKAQGSEAKEVSKAFLEQADAFELLQMQAETYGQFMAAMSASVSSKLIPVNEQLTKLWAEQGEELRVIEPELDAIITKFEESQQAVKDLNASLNQISEAGLENLVVSVAESAVGLAMGAESVADAGRGILMAIADFISAFGKALIAYGISITAFEEAFANPAAAIIAGVAAVSTAAIIKALANAGPKVPALATGGLAYAPTLAMVGDNPNAGSDPEVIAPLSKLMKIMGKQGGDVTVRGQLVGNDIYITNKRTYGRIERISGY